MTLKLFLTAALLTSITAFAAAPRTAPTDSLTLNCRFAVLTDLYKGTRLLGAHVSLTYKQGQTDDSQSHLIVMGDDNKGAVKILRGKDLYDFEAWNATEPYMELKVYAGTTDFGTYKPFGTALEIKFVDPASGRNFLHTSKMSGDNPPHELFIQNFNEDSLERDKVNHSGLYFKGVCARPDIPDHE